MSMNYNKSDEELANDITDKQQAEEKKQAEEQKTPSVYRNLWHAISKYDSDKHARMAILIWITFGLSLLWVFVASFSFFLTGERRFSLFLMLIAFTLVNIYWFVRFGIMMLQMYHSPSMARKVMGLTLVPSVLWLVTMGITALFIPVEQTTLIGWSIAGIVVFWLLYGLSYNFEIWFVSLNDGIFRYHLPFMTENSKITFTKQKYPESEILEACIERFESLHIPDTHLYTYLDFRGDDTKRRDILTDVYNHYEQKIFDLREQKKKAGIDYPSELDEDLQFTDEIEKERKILEERLRSIGLDEVVTELEETESLFFALEKAINTPGFMPLPYQWIKTLDNNHPLWVSNRFVSVAVPLRELSTISGVTFDMDVTFSLTFKPQNIRLPWVRRNMKNHTSLDELQKFLKELFKGVTLRESRGFFINYKFIDAITVGAYHDYRRKLPNIVGGMAKNFGVTVHSWSVQTQVIVSDELRKHINDDQIGDRATLIKLIESINKGGHANHAIVELIDRFASLDRKISQAQDTPKQLPAQPEEPTPVHSSSQPATDRIDYTPDEPARVLDTQETNQQASVDQEPDFDENEQSVPPKPTSRPPRTRPIKSDDVNNAVNGHKQETKTQSPSVDDDIFAEDIGLDYRNRPQPDDDLERRKKRLDDNFHIDD